MDLSAFADPNWSIARGIASSHHLLPGQWNEVHPYVSASRESDGGLEYGIGRFLNSEGSDSAYVGVKPRSGPLWAELGLATGYEAAPVIPWGRVGIDIADGFSAFAAPAYDTTTGNLGAVLGLNADLMEW